jgi:hypothetical protein
MFEGKEGAYHEYMKDSVENIRVIRVEVMSTRKAVGK